ncbi:MAG: DUF4101 domain-containing protein [Okeania sp. SIO3I5]|uniref:ARC6/PARC6 family protein n=1 Tax=Okeania sp. SIO3I5 TaxID=2607805 RepID=UPI0013BA7280|nr:IMS domain-containing protein [Okeania sp. SIO3I5]NEQ36857.1 DUF4101 domain-containing protein [Okeania sp. SIO3I5]
MKQSTTYASDIYSLGLIAIYLLRGKVPDGKLSWRQDAPNISSEFADILDKSIEENLSDRYQTATEMLTAIKNIKTSYSIPNTKQQISRTQPSLKPTQKISPVTITNSENSQWLKTGTVAAIFGIISTGTFTFYNNKIEQPMLQLDGPPIEIPEPNRINLAASEPITEEVARLTIQSWLDAKTSALGPNHQIEQLPNILVVPALSRWLPTANALKREKSYRKYEHDFDIKSVKMSNTDANEAQVDVQLREKVEFYDENGRLTNSDNENLLVRYNLVRWNQKWYISNWKILR